VAQGWSGAAVARRASTTYRALAPDRWLALSASRRACSPSSSCADTPVGGVDRYVICSAWCAVVPGWCPGHAYARRALTNARAAWRSPVHLLVDRAARELYWRSCRQSALATRRPTRSNRSREAMPRAMGGAGGVRHNISDLLWAQRGSRQRGFAASSVAAMPRHRRGVRHVRVSARATRAAAARGGRSSRAPRQVIFFAARLTGWHSLRSMATPACRAPGARSLGECSRAGGGGSPQARRRRQRGAADERARRRRRHAEET
jgi:hypothetical protein